MNLLNKLKEYYNLIFKKQIVKRQVTLLYINKLNKNGRIYNLENTQSAISSLNKREYPLYGELGYPDSFDSSLRSLSHTIQNIHISGNEVIGEVTTLNTPMGKILLKNFDDYVIRPRSTGSVDSDGNVTVEKIYTFDAILKKDDSFNL